MNDSFATVRSVEVSRRTILKTFAAGAATLYLGACGNDSSGAGTSSNTVRYTTSWDPTSEDPRAKSQAAILEAFTEQHGIEVELTYVPWNQSHTTLIREAEAGRAPDVSLQMDSNLLTLIEQDAILPITQLTSDWSQERKDDYLFPFDDMVFDGEQYAFRQSPRPANVLFYRKDVFDSEGVEPPRTADEWADIAAELSGSGAFGFGVPLGSATDMNRFIAGFTSMLWARDGDLFDLDAHKPRFAEDPGVYALDWMRGLIERSAMSPSIATATAETVDQQFTAGTLLTTIANAGNLGDYRSRREGEWVGAASFPNFANDTNTPGPAYLAGGWTMVMPKGANQDTAWKLLEFYQETEAEVLKATIGNELPTRKSTLDDPFFDTPEAEQMRQWLDWLAANPVAAPLKVPQYQELVQSLYDAVQAVLVNDTDPKEALQTAADRYESTLG